MTIPISVVRRAVVRAKRGEFSDFFYVRRFDPTAGGAPVYVAVTCRLTGGTARTPLSLNRVELYGVEPNNNRVRLLRVDGDNIKTGVIKADIRYTGTGLLEGWWEVATPTDQVIAEVDRFTAGSISEDQRTVQRRFRRVKRFRVQVPLSGRLTLKGPRYSELPHQTPGFYQVILRIEASKGQASRSNLANRGGSQTLFSGGVAGFPLQALRYRVGDLEAAQSAALNPRLTVDDPGGGKARQVAMVWDVLQNGAVAVMVEVFDPESQEKHQLAAPMSKGLVILPRRWTEGRDVDSLRYMVTVLGRDQKPVGERITVSRVK
jgi:hypothetical protein